jgi:hypothetical protein
LKKTLSVLALVIFLLAGCQVGNNELDTTKLKKVDMKDVTEEQKKNMPFTYEAPSVKVGLAALPFEMKLPKKLPFEAAPFQPPIINDMNRDGKILNVDFRAFSKNKEENIILMVRAGYPVGDSQTPNAEKVKLKNKVVGEYSTNGVSFLIDDVSYDVVYVNKNIPIEQHKEDVIQITNQMIE